VYNAANPDYRLHVEETWANLTSINNLTTTTRSDGGPPHRLSFGTTAIYQYGSVVNQPDGFGSAKYIHIDFDSDGPIPPHGARGGCTDPAVIAAHQAGYHWAGAGTGSFCGDNNGQGSGFQRGFQMGPYLNTPTKDAVVYEFAVRHTGTHWYSHGKLFDVGSASGGVGRFNYDPFAWNLGVGQPSTCDNDSYGFCPLFYSNGGQTSRYSGQPPRWNTAAPAFARSQMAELAAIIGAGGIIIYKQNKGYGTGPGQFDLLNNWDLTGTGKGPNGGGWLYTKIRITREDPSNYVYGRGRIEVWVGTTPGSLVKVMEYLGDDPTRPEYGKVWVDPTGSSTMPEGAYLSATTDLNYTGGAHLDWGMLRVWSESRH
jgi:hypothetical protein